MNLLFCIDTKFLDLFATCLRSIVRNGGADHYDVYVFHSDLADTDQAALRCAFREDVTFRFVLLSDELFADFPESDRYPKQIYYRLAAPRFLPDTLDRILYLDVDLVVINPLTELYEMEFNHHCYIGCTHTRKFLTKLNRARLQSDRVVSYINTGMLLMNLELLRETLDLDEIGRYTNAHRRALFLPDQDILSALYGDRVKVVDTLRYNLSDRILRFHNASSHREKLDVDWVRKHGVIIHYCGKNKPWHEDYNGILGVFYHEQKQQPK